MYYSILLIGIASVLAPWLHRRFRGWAQYLLALVPAGVALGFLGGAWGEVQAVSAPWVSGLGLDLAWLLDDWSRLFAALISGIGALVVVYAGHYLEEDPTAGRFLSALLAFMASMLGLVLSDSFILMFVFWELTSLTSYLLIGHKHAKEGARKAALQSLLVTVGGGLFLMAGLLLLGSSSGAWTFTALAKSSVPVADLPFAGLALVLILVGCFTKSAQVPFHFWLPNAMEAPAPASAFLHSATMVKAGIFLLGRLVPSHGDHAWWGPLLQAFGGVTFLLGAAMTLRVTKMKQVLAYTTIAVLGLLVLLLGVNTPISLRAVALLVPAHALYKGALFLVAGGVDHETGESDLTRLSGLGGSMPGLFGAGALAVLSMVGLLPFLGFITKELVLEAMVGASWWMALPGAVLLALLGGAGLAVGIGPFLGRPGATPAPAHAPPFGIWAPPLLMGLVSLALGVYLRPLGAMSASVASGMAPGVEGGPLSLWHGFTPVLGVSVMALLAAVGFWRFRDPMLAVASRLPSMAAWGPSGLYQGMLRVVDTTAKLHTRGLQSGMLTRYLKLVFGVLVVLVLIAIYPLLGALQLPGGFAWRWYEAGLAVVILGAVAWCVRTRTRLGAIIALGVVGYSIAILFLIFGAPDLAMTQFAVETLTVILFVLSLHRLPPFFAHERGRDRLLNVVVAAGVGLVMAVLTYLASTAPKDRGLMAFYMDSSLLLAHGRNVVNVILVDFRGLDTLGEITVLAVVAMGASALLRLKARREDGNV